ncbi:MAG: post-transcriptional regulator [Bacilli bacterium]|nr:post-transcriptional regulator [Bacilli bacterium]
MEFSSLVELYNHIKPALVTRKNEIALLEKAYINESDIWNYLKEIKWRSSKNLSLSEMVDDILNTEVYVIDNYLKEKITKEREVYFKGEINEEETYN